MKKVLMALVVLLVVGAGLLASLSAHGLGDLVVWNEESKELREKARDFLNDIKFKDFKRAGGYHNWADSQKENIPQLIERLFQIKPELLDLHDHEITKVDIDESGQRARTLFKAHYRVLNSRKNPDEKDEEKVLEGILYWHKLAESEARPEGAAPAPVATSGPGVPAAFRVDKDGKRWFMMLESSLR